MSDNDRGPYAPSSDRLAFERRGPVRSRGPAPVTLIVSGVVLVGLVGAVLYLYRGGVRRHADASGVGVAVAQIKTPAPPPSNSAPPPLTVEPTAAANTAPVFTAPPEEPHPRPVLAAGPPTSGQPASVPASQPPPAPPVVIPPPAKPVTLAGLADPAAQSTARPAKPAPTIASLADAAIAAPSTPHPSPGAVGWIQIGAYSSRAQADTGWSAIKRLAPQSMSGKGEKVEVVARGTETFYRAYITGFSGRDAAQAFCDKLKAAGKSCLVK
jgi:hypothetical protein